MVDNEVAAEYLEYRCLTTLLSNLYEIVTLDNVPKKDEANKMANLKISDKPENEIHDSKNILSNK